MKKRTIDTYIWLGTSLRYLESAVDGTSLDGEGEVLYNIDGFMKALEANGFQVTTRAAKYARLHEVEEKLKERVEEESSPRLTSEEQKELSETMTAIRTTLIAEAGGTVAYMLSDERIDVTKLLDKPGSLLASGIHDELSDMARYDFGEACKCVAFERPTAAAFHLMRLAEQVLRELYTQEVKRGRVSPLLWGPMIDHLRQRSKPPPEVLLDQWDGIRKHYRNPTQHPEAIYDLHEAQDLFSVTVDAVTRAVRYMAA